MKSTIGLFLVGCAVIGTLFTLTNYGNHAVDGGYVAYVYTNPIWGKKQFDSTINGPGGTGYWAWRRETLNISVTPWTMEEKFNDILAKDKLMMQAQASLVFRIDRTKVREFVEDYGAMNEVGKNEPSAIIKDAYNSFIQQHFRSAIRSEVSKYNGLDASANIPQITRAVEAELKRKFEGTPFIVESVTIGSTTPPKSVTDGVTKKVEQTQAYERQTIERQMAEQQIEIQKAQGQAAANKAAEEAEGRKRVAQAEADAALYKQQRDAEARLFSAQKEAEGILMVATANAEGKKKEAEALDQYSRAIGGNYVSLKFVENLDKLKLPNTVVGADFVGQLSGMLRGVTIDGTPVLKTVAPGVITAE